MSPAVDGWTILALAAGVFVAVRLGRLLVAAVLVLVLALCAGLLPVLSGGRPAGGPLAPGAPVPAEYRQWIIRAGQQCPAISPALLAAQLAVESGFNPRAHSPAGAQGIAQFMPGTWPTWAVDADGNGVASPWEPADAITAQGAFMCALADRYGGDTVRVLAAYNAGPGAVDAAGGIPPIAETRSYVQRVTALIPTYTAPSHL